MALTEEAFRKWKQISNDSVGLNEDELEIVLLVIQGLSSGKHVYGSLCIRIDERDFKDEAVQELRDCLVYTNAALLRLLSSKTKEG